MRGDSPCLGHARRGDLVSREPAASAESAVPSEPSGDEGGGREGNGVSLVIGSWPRIWKLDFHSQTCPISVCPSGQPSAGWGGRTY